MSTSKRQYLQTLDKVEEPIRQEFMEFVRIVVGVATVAEVEAQLRERDVDGVLRALRVNQAALSGTTEAIREAYSAGGRLEAPSARITFDMRNPRAERWLRNHSSEFVTRIVAGQREAIRITLEAGMELGRNPRHTALDIVGRVGPNGRRTGGIVGLTDQQAGFAANARRQLLSGDPAQMNEYFTRTRRDRRFDGIVRRAINEGRPVPASDADRIVGRYSDRLLQTRGNAIARTESLNALSEAREQAWHQAIEEGVVDSDTVVSEWSTAGDGRVRDAHAAMHGQRRPFGVPFESPTGARLMHPGDSSLGAGPEDVIQCRCMSVVRADFIGAAARRFT